MYFKDIIGQNRIKDQLVQSISENRLSHALLFNGPEGSGNLPLAIAMSQFIVCENKTTESCGQCKACQKAEKLIHPDIHFVFPVIGTDKTADDFIAEFREMILSNPYTGYNDWLGQMDAENKQANVNKKECLQIIRKLGLKAFESEYKIVVFWLPEFLGKEGNRLLKIIEEPPKNTVFLFASENQDRILNTILSRLQLIKVNRLSDHEVTEALIQRNNISGEAAHQISSVCEGNFSEALRLLTLEEKDISHHLTAWLEFCHNGDMMGIFQFTDEFASWKREEQKSFIQYSLHFFRECLAGAFGSQISVKLLGKEAELAQNFQDYVSWESIGKISTLLDKSYYYLERYIHPKILIFNISNQISRTLQSAKKVKHQAQA